MALTAPVTNFDRLVEAPSRRAAHVHSGLVNHKFHRPAFAGRRHAAHIVKRLAQWTIQAGDTGNKIAAQLGVHFDQLASLNPTVEWSSLKIGSTLNTPGNSNSEGHYYTAAAGDTGDIVAAANGIKFAQLAAYNRDIDWRNLQVGQLLYIPGPASDPSQTPFLDLEPGEQDVNVTAHDPGSVSLFIIDVGTAVVSSTKDVPSFLTPGETSSPSGLYVSHTLKARQVPRPPAGTSQASTSATYIVKAGDTGYDIANRLGITFDALSSANPGVNWLNLQVGQSLNLPGGTASSATVIVPIPQGTYPSQSSPSPTPKQRIGVYVTYSGAINAARPPYPLMSSWIPFAQLWTMNTANIGTTCVFASGSVPPNTASENASLKSNILSVSAATGVDPSFILAVVLQESNGCVRVPTTSSWQGISNPGLMQSFNGRASCNTKGRMQQPCPDYMIKAMITEGVKGVRNVGIIPALSTAAQQDGTQWSVTGSANVNAQTNGTSNSASAISARPIDQALLYYQAARIYNSGSLSADGDLSSPTGSTRCYVSDVVNRLLGWTGAGGSCSLH